VGGTRGLAVGDRLVVPQQDAGRGDSAVAVAFQARGYLGEMAGNGSPSRRLLFGSFAGYDKRPLRGDLIAGLTVWAVLVPEALAYATIAGVSPVVGLYAAPPALLLYALFGSSRHLVVGPMSATAALSAAAVADLHPARVPDDRRRRR
jgi:hypothetical protein